MAALYGNVKFYTPSSKFKENSFNIINEQTGLIYYGQHGIELNDPHYGMKIDEYLGFPFVLNRDGSLWEDASRFFILKLKHKPEISEEWLRQFGDTLQEFRQWCEMMEDKESDELRPFNYLEAPIKSRRPNVMFGVYLRSTEAKQWKKKMAFVGMFYEYLIDTRKVRGLGTKEYLLEWEEKDMIVPSKGGGFIKTYSSRGTEKESQSQSNTGEFITDGGDKMRPMSIDEEMLFDEAMGNYTHEELFLGHAISISSFARKQTVYTLRIKHFVNDLPKNYDEYTVNQWLIKKFESIDDFEMQLIQVGDGTGCDTKNGKRFKIELEGWLFKTIISYIVSPRAASYRKGALSQNRDIDQYVFLTEDHHPIYHAKDDINLSAWKESHKGKSKKGESIDQQMKYFRDKYLYPLCEQHKKSKFGVRFHDFRATAAMRHLDKNEYLVQEGKASWPAVIKKLSEKMAHMSEKTTYGYLQFREEQGLVQGVNLEHEKSRMEVIRGRTRYPKA